LKRRLTRVLDPNARRDPAAPAWAFACAAGALLIAAPLAAFSPVDYAPARTALAARALPAVTADAALPAAPAKTQNDDARALSVRADRLTADTLVALRVNGVTGEYIEALERAYPPARDMSYDDFISFAALGVTPDWIGAIASAGYADLTPDEVTAFKATGVSPAYVRELSDAGLSALSADDVIGLRANGVTGAYIRALRDAGLAQLSADEVLDLRVNGITPEEVRAMAPRGDELEGAQER
jgi:hypothetical protein